MEKGPMLRADNGDIVKINYTLSLKDRDAAAPSTEELTFEFMIGRGSVLPTFEQAVAGMREGETKSFTVSPEKAFGGYLDNLIHVIERDMLPRDVTPEVGMMLRLKTDEGKEIEARVTEVEDSTVKVDANNEFAGKEIVFEIRLLKIIRPR